MNSLYLIRQDGGKIALADFLTSVSALSGVQNLKTKDVFLASAEADYFYEGDRTIIRLDKEEQMIEITGLGKSSVHIAYEFQRGYAHPLRLFDTNYAFDLDLSDIKTTAELERKMNLAP